MAVLASNRSETSYVAGGAMLNRDWPRISDDIDFFHDTDEEIVAAARKDIKSLENAGFSVHTDIEIYGVVEATVSELGTSTTLQWMSETKRRYLPLVRDEEYGFRLAQADLAVNKILAASARQKARDYVDLVAIESNWCPLGPLVLAASGKPPFFSPQRIIDEIRRRGMGVWNEDYQSVRGIPVNWTPEFIREALAKAIDLAETYVMKAPRSALGRLVLDPETSIPVEVADENSAGLEFRMATEEPDPVPELKDAPFGWTK